MHLRRRCHTRCKAFAGGFCPLVQFADKLAGPYRTGRIYRCSSARAQAAAAATGAFWCRGRKACGLPAGGWQVRTYRLLS